MLIKVSERLYTQDMARGWESKEVESQIDAAQAAKAARAAATKSPEEIQKEGQRNSLMLSRTRVLRDLQCACNPRYRKQLEQALAYLDQQLAAVDSPPREG